MDKKLGIIIPYRGEYGKLDRFCGHMDYFLTEQGNKNYTMCIVEQKDDKPFNVGALYNVGYDLLKDECDYFVFHDVNYIPMENSIDYSYTTEVQHMCSNVDSFGYKKPYLEWLGGAVKMTGYIFEKVNGYSNEYWGYGMEDIDMLHRLSLEEVSKIKRFFSIDTTKPHDIFDVVESNALRRVNLNYMDFARTDSAALIKHTDKNKYIFQDSFTIDFFAYIEPNRNNDAFIIGKEGYNTGLMLKENKALNFQLWNTENEIFQIWYEHYNLANKWIKITLRFDYDDQTISLFLDGQLVKTERFEGEVMDYTNKDIWIGSLAYKNQFYGKISNLKIYDYALSNFEILNVYNEIYKTDEELKLTKEEPIIDIPFTKKYKDFFIDFAKFESHLLDMSFNKSLNIIKEENINLNYECMFPPEIYGKFKCIDIEQVNDDKNKWRWGQDEDLEENKAIFYQDVVKNKVYYKKEGLSNLNYELFDKEIKSETSTIYRIKF